MNREMNWMCLTSDTISYVDVDDGKGISITDEELRIGHNRKLDFEMKNVLIVWRGSVSGSGVMLEKGTAWKLEVDGAGVKATVGGVEISADVTVSDVHTYMIMCVESMASLYVDGELQETVSVDRANTDNADDLYVGRTNGVITDVRMYGGESVSERFVGQVNDVVGRSRHVMWYGGEVWKKKNITVKKVIEVRSYGSRLGDTEVRGNVYRDTTIDAIVKDLIETHTDLTVVSLDRELAIDSLVSDGSLLDMITDLSRVSNSTWAVDARKNMVFENKESGCF